MISFFYHRIVTMYVLRFVDSIGGDRVQADERMHRKLEQNYWLSLTRCRPIVELGLLHRD